MDEGRRLESQRLSLKIMRKRCISGKKTATTRSSSGILTQRAILSTQSALQSLHLNTEKLKLELNNVQALTLRSKMLNRLLSGRDLVALKTNCVQVQKQILIADNSKKQSYKLPQQADLERSRLVNYKLRLDITILTQSICKKMNQQTKQGEQSRSENIAFSLQDGNRKILDELNNQKCNLHRKINEQKDIALKVENVTKREKKKMFELIQLKRTLRNPKQLIYKLIN